MAMVCLAKKKCHWGGGGSGFSLVECRANLFDQF